MEYVHQRAENLALLIYSGGECPEGLTVYEEKRAVAGPLLFIARIIGESHAVSVTSPCGSGLTEVLACVPGEAIPGKPLVNLPVTGPWPFVLEIGGWTCTCRIETRRFGGDEEYAEGFWTARSFLDAPPAAGCAAFPIERVECRFPEGPDKVPAPGHFVTPMTSVTIFACRCCEIENHEELKGHAALAWKSLHTYTDERTLILSETVVAAPAMAVR